MRRTWLACAALACAALLLFALPLRAGEEVDLRLALMVDASGSVDAQEYRLQRLGYIQAFRDPRILEVIRSGYRGRIAVTFVEWTGPGLQATIADWAVLSDQASVERFTGELQSQPRMLYGGGTSVGAAILFGAQVIEECENPSERRVIDVSGDGSNNRGISARQARDLVVSQGYVVNGLPILTDEPYLDKYYEQEVIGGPGAFMIPAKGFDDFARAIRAKLIREIAGVDLDPVIETARR